MLASGLRISWFWAVTPLWLNASQTRGMIRKKLKHVILKLIMTDVALVINGTGYQYKQKAYGSIPIHEILYVNVVTKFSSSSIAR